MLFQDSTYSVSASVMRGTACVELISSMRIPQGFMLPPLGTLTWPTIELSIWARSSRPKEVSFKRAFHSRQRVEVLIVRLAVNVINGPVVSPLGRMTLGGRNWEGSGPDPYLSGILVGVTIEGFQESVIAAVKHLLGYEQETQRSGVDGGNASYSVNIDDKTMHELYLWPFMDAVHAGAGSVMCS